MDSEEWQRAEKLFKLFYEEYELRDNVIVKLTAEITDEKDRDWTLDKELLMITKVENGVGVCGVAIRGLRAVIILFQPFF